MPFRRSLFAVLASLSTAATMLAVPSPAAAYSQIGRVIQVLDGDTFDIDFPGDGRGPVRVRLAGVNAMEHNAEVSSCHGGTAFRRMNKLLGGRRVRVLAANRSSTASKGRALRFVELLDGTDVGAVLARAGLAWAYPSNIEPARNERYMKLSRIAQNHDRQIWDDGDCGWGPRQRTPLRMRLHWDGPGQDNDFINGEWVRLHNDGSRPLPLRGWILRDSSNYTYTFRRGVRIPAHGSITVYVGAGNNTATRLYWGNQEFHRQSIFGNVGDGAYLIDPDNDIRVSREYGAKA